MTKKGGNRSDVIATAEIVDHHFLSLGVQYYISERAAFLAGQAPVCANLFHHAVEMLLKARLSQKHTLPQLFERFRHRLNAIWRAFKAEFPNENFAQFDNVIVDLAKFERLRYPDNAVKEGMQVLLQLEPDTFRVIMGSGLKEPPRYVLAVSEIDQLIAKIFEVSSCNPMFFTGVFNDFAHDAITKNNPVADKFVRQRGS